MTAPPSGIDHPALNKLGHMEALMTQPLTNVERKLIGHIGVDSARVIVCDPHYIVPQRLSERQSEREDASLAADNAARARRTDTSRWDDETTQAIREAWPTTYQLPYTNGHEGAAVVVHSGIGDGFYPVYGTFAAVASMGQRLVRMEVDFLDHVMLETVPLKMPDGLGKLLVELKEWFEATPRGEERDHTRAFCHRIQQVLDAYRHDQG